MHSTSWRVFASAGGANVRWTCGRGGIICALRQCVEESATDDDDDDENDEG